MLRRGPVGLFSEHGWARPASDFSVDGSGFRALDDTVPIAGPTRDLQVYQARAQLVPNPGEQ